MKRRTLLQSVLSALLVAPATRLRLFGQAAPGLTAVNVTTLQAIAEVVLPSALGTEGRAAAVERFAQWVRGYREGAERGYSYGSSTLSQPSGPSPAARYPPQFVALDELAVTRGATSFAALSPDRRREVIATVLDQPQRVTALPGRPNGANLIADFMGYYFASDAGFDLAYNAAIGRDRCRGLDGSDRPPAPLTSA